MVKNELKKGSRAMSTMHSRKTHSLGRRRILDISALLTKFPTSSLKILLKSVQYVSYTLESNENWPRFSPSLRGPVIWGKMRLLIGATNLPILHCHDKDVEIDITNAELRRRRESQRSNYSDRSRGSNGSSELMVLGKFKSIIKCYD